MLKGIPQILQMYEHTDLQNHVSKTKISSIFLFFFVHTMEPQLIPTKQSNQVEIDL